MRFLAIASLVIISGCRGAPVLELPPKLDNNNAPSERVFGYRNRETVEFGTGFIDPLNWTTNLRQGQIAKIQYCTLNQVNGGYACLKGAISFVFPYECHYPKIGERITTNGVTSILMAVGDFPNADLVHPYRPRQLTNQFYAMIEGRGHNQKITFVKYRGANGLQQFAFADGDLQTAWRTVFDLEKKEFRAQFASGTISPPSQIAIAACYENYDEPETWDLR